MNLTVLPYLPMTPTRIDDPELQRYLRELDAAMRQILTSVYIDLSQGKSTFTPFAALPTALEVDEHQFVLRTDSGTIYTKIDGVIRQLTAGGDVDASEKTWAFMSRDANSGTNYIGGFYAFGAAANDFNPAITFGTANASYAAHLFLVQAAGGGGGTDTVVRVTGTTINDQGVRAAGATVDITVDDAGVANTYYETDEKWIGQVTVTKLSGPDLLCNYGFCKYWDNNNTDFTVAGFEATWLGAKNDATPDIKLRHHKTTGWTYNAGAPPTPPTPIATMVGDHVTEIQIRTDEEGAWKRDNLDTDVDGSGSEGTMIELVTTTNRTYGIGNFLMRITAQ